MARELCDTVNLLRASGLLATAKLEADGRVSVLLGDRVNGVRAMRTFRFTDEAEAWLRVRALEWYPDCAYAAASGLIARAIAAARRSPRKTSRQAT